MTDHGDFRAAGNLDEALSTERCITRNGLTIIPPYETWLRRHGLDSLDALFVCTDGDRLDKPGLASWRQRWRLVLTGDSGPVTVYLKRFVNPPGSARREVRRSGTGATSVAGLEWHWAHRLARHGVPCVEPVAFGEELDGSREVRSAILTTAVPGASLESWAARWTEAERGDARRLIPSLARLVARLHEGGFFHRDLYLSHVFFDPAAPAERSLRLIDLQRIIRPCCGLRRWIVKDLAALDYSTPACLASRADRLRWLKLYLGATKLDASARRLVYRVIGRTRRIERRERKHAGRRGVRPS